MCSRAENLLRLVFINDGVGVGVGVIIRSAERYDLVKIKPVDAAYDSIAYDLVKTRLLKS